MPATRTVVSAADQRASLHGVLDCAWDADTFTATDAMTSAEVTRSTAIAALDTLVAAGVLRELPDARAAGEYRRGRPARRFALAADAGTLVAVDAGHTHLAVSVSDLRGGVLHRDRHAFADGTPSTRRRAIGHAVFDAVQAAGRQPADVLAVCAGVAAPVDADGRSPHHSTGFWERMNPDLYELFAAHAPLVRVDNDASLAAVAEGAAGAARGCADYITLLAGDRFGAGVVVDGRLLRGRHGGVGEMIAFDHVVGVETVNGLGLQLQEWARQAVADGTVRDGGALAGMPVEDVDAPLVLQLAAAGDADAQDIVQRTARMLARIVGVLGSMFDPQRVVISGAVADSIAPVVDAARVLLPTNLDLPAPELAVSSLGADVVLTGAAHAARDLARRHILDVLPLGGE